VQLGARILNVAQEHEELERILPFGPRRPVHRVHDHRIHALEHPVDAPAARAIPDGDGSRDVVRDLLDHREAVALGILATSLQLRR